MVDVELQEQSVPLKSAEQGTEGAETAAGGTSQQQEQSIETKIVKEKKSWFSKKKAAKTDVSGEKGGASVEVDGEGGVNNVNEKKKGAGPKGPKCPFTFCRSQKVEGQQQQGEGIDSGAGQQPTFQFDMVQRDAAKLHESIDLGIENIFGEPDAVHSINGVWKAALTVFLAVRNFCYKLISLLFAVPLAILFGVLFAVFSALSVFLFVPVGRLLAIPFGWLAKIWSALISAFCDPLFGSISLIFGNIKMSRYGINQDPTAVLTAA